MIERPALRIVLASVESALADAWHRHCGDLPGVSVHRGSILDLRVDAVVSPANSFGFMDGGIDAIYLRHFGAGVQERLQSAIRERHHGELLVGAAEIVDTGDPRIPYLVAAPTMRVPMILSETVNAYLAARATLLLAMHGDFPSGGRVSDSVTSLAFPGLGTGVGRMDFDTCARQVRAAIEEVCHRGSSFPATWLEAQIRHQKLYSDHARDLQQD